MADRAEVALPNFQRSYVWPDDRIADYILALFDNRPTGIFLILEVGDELNFESRTLKGVNANPVDARELLLDGQQRLTSLWRVLNGRATREYYLQLEDIENRNMGVKCVVSYAKQSRRGKAMRDPKNAHDSSLLPLSLLLDGTPINDEIHQGDPDEPGETWKWCEQACKDGGAARKLEKAIEKRVRQPFLLERQLHYCALPAETEPQIAINIFVETNKSSTKIRMFDIAVALAQGEFSEDFRDRIIKFYEKHSEVGYYFHGEQEKWIPQIGEWILKVACLSASSPLPPKEANFQSALTDLFQTNPMEAMNRIDILQEDLVNAIDSAAAIGGSTKQTLPTWPSVHVIAALQRDLRAIRNPAWKGTASRLLTAYMWRSCLTSRYEVQANDRLLEDFRVLKDCLCQISTNGSYKKLPPIFEDDDYPVPTMSDLQEFDKPVQWINSGRFGRALAAVAMQKKPLDWVTGNELNVRRVRELERARQLDRHHVYPKKLLVGKDFTLDQINHGLNGVILSKEGNLFLGQKAPEVYLKKILKKSKGLEESELRKRVNSHLVPFDTLMKSESDPRQSYEEFIRKRAKLVSSEIDRLVSP